MLNILKIEQDFTEINEDLVSRLNRLADGYANGTFVDNESNKTHQQLVKRKQLVSMLKNYPVMLNRYQHLPDQIIIALTEKHKAQIAAEKSGSRRQKLQASYDELLTQNMVESVSKTAIIRTKEWHSLPRNIASTKQKSLKVGSAVRANNMIWKVSDIIDGHSYDNVKLNLLYGTRFDKKLCSRIELFSERDCTLLKPNWEQQIIKYKKALEELEIEHRKRCVELEKTLSLV